MILTPDYACLYMHSGSVVFLCREFIPFLPVGREFPNGPIDPPLLKDSAPEGFWEENCNELFGAASHISDLMRDLRVAGAAIHTPFAGLCAFTSALMQLYAAYFPSYVGPIASERAIEKAAESMKDLTRICDLWKLGEEWFNVLDTAKSLFSRVNSSRQAQQVQGSRDNYPELEDSINFGPLQGMPQHSPSMDRNCNKDDDRLENDPTETSLDIAIGSIDNLSVPYVFDFGNMDEDGYRLWSFWDDPHLLSTNHLG